MKSISTFGEPKGDMVALITESVTVFSFDAVGFALKFHLVSPGKSRYRRCEVALHLYDYRVNQACASSPLDANWDIDNGGSPITTWCTPVRGVSSPSSGW